MECLHVKLKSIVSIAVDLDNWRARLIKQSEIWQQDLLTPQKLWKFCADRNVRLFNYQTIESLWALALIRADIIIAVSPVNIEGLVLVSENEGEYHYLDTRKPAQRDGGFGGSFAEAECPENIHLYFHPFRFYPLYHVKRVFDSHISATQFLLNPPGYMTVTQHEIKHLSDWTARPEFPGIFDEWNKTAEAAIVFEPYSHAQVFKQLKWRFPDTEESITEKLDKYRRAVNDAIEENDKAILEEYRHKLCIAAEEIDSNKILHVLLRLTEWHRQQKIKSSIGGALLLSSMAEVIRRPVESALDIQLPEEDELGFGLWFPEGRKILYGTDRVLDASPGDLHDFIFDAGLDLGTRVRCYVEGDTELGALEYALDQFSNIQIVNLKGQVAERMGRGVAFKDSLRNDLDAGDFTFVYIDADREDFLRATRKAAEEDILTGGFSISTPDIEFANFTAGELAEVALQMAEELEVPIQDKERFLQETSDVTMTEEFFKVLRRLGVDRAIDKGKLWGGALMKYALENEKDCPMVEAAKQIAHATRCKFQYSREKFCIDATTGNPIERETFSARVE